MRAAKIGLLTMSVMAVATGFIFAAQGSGYFPYPADSFMINHSSWILRGAIVVIAGAIGIVLSRLM